MEAIPLPLWPLSLFPSLCLCMSSIGNFIFFMHGPAAADLRDTSKASHRAPSLEVGSSSHVSFEFPTLFYGSSHVDKVSHSVLGPPGASHSGAVCRSPTGLQGSESTHNFLRRWPGLFEVLCGNTKTAMLVTPHTAVASCWQRRCLPVFGRTALCLYSWHQHSWRAVLGLQLRKTHGLEKGGAA